METKTAAEQDRLSQSFAVYPGDGSLPFLTDHRAEAIDLAHKTNGNWTRVPRETVAKDLI